MKILASIKLTLILLVIIPGLMICSNNLMAQTTPCIEESRVNPFAPCFQPYDPVCGCDGITYRNECFSYTKAGVNFITPGPCGDLDIDLVPNPVFDYGYLSVAMKFPQPVEITIYDSFGVQMFGRTITGQERIQLEFSVFNYKVGVYHIIVKTPNSREIRKFIRAVYL